MRNLPLPLCSSSFTCSLSSSSKLKYKLGELKDLAKSKSQEPKDPRYLKRYDDILDLEFKMDSAVEDWFSDWSNVLPGAAFEEQADTADSGDRLLRFPSDYSPESRSRLGLEGLARTERELRLGLAFDCLKHLRDFLGLKSFLARRKYGKITGLRSNQVLEQSLSSAEKKCRFWKYTYRKNYRCLERLKEGCGPEAYPTELDRLAELHDEDCVMLNKWLDGHRAQRAAGENAPGGDIRVALPWIWKMDFVDFNINLEFDDRGRPITTQVDQWTDEGEWPPKVTDLYIADLLCVDLLFAASNCGRLIYF